VFDNNQRIQIEEKERNYTERRTINDWHDAPMVSVGSLATKTLAFAKIRPLCGSAYLSWSGASWACVPLLILGWYMFSPLS
jgi:hypothetical protein